MTASVRTEVLWHFRLPYPHTRPPTQLFGSFENPQPTAREDGNTALGPTNLILNYLTLLVTPWKMSFEKLSFFNLTGYLLCENLFPREHLPKINRSN